MRLVLARVVGTRKRIRRGSRAVGRVARCGGGRRRSQRLDLARPEACCAGKLTRLIRIEAGFFEPHQSRHVGLGLRQIFRTQSGKLIALNDSQSVAGFGDTAAEAMDAFDTAYHEQQHLPVEPPAEQPAPQPSTSPVRKPRARKK